jgi:hypothetical protein
MCPSNIKDWLQIVAYLVDMVAASVSVVQYLHNSRREPLRWLYDMHQRLYNDPELSSVRIKLELG